MAAEPPRRGLFARALAAFLLMPGLVAYALPVAIGLSDGPARRVSAAAALVAAGTLLLLACVREFYVAGRGTLAPWSPPEHLVTTGPYRFSRNPMYVAVLTVLAGWCVLWDSGALKIYLAATLGAFLVRVIGFEEPWAARRFPAEWQAYRARTPRWLLHIPRAKGDP